jgi:hypothetical protein
MGQEHPTDVVSEPDDGELAANNAHVEDEEPDKDGDVILSSVDDGSESSGDDYDALDEAGEYE